MTLASALQQMTAKYQQGAELVLLFDYDGTLVSLAEHPLSATLPPDTRRVLQRLARKPRVRLGVLSGRGIADLAPMFPAPEVILAGVSGLELRLDGKRFVHPRWCAIVTVIKQVVKQLHRTVSAFPQAWVEDKRLGCTLHYRAVKLQHREPLLLQAREVLSHWRGKLQIAPGPAALEIMPEVGWDKGVCVRMILKRLQPANYALLYAGDGDNDAAAQRVVSALGGVAIGIGDGASATVQYRLPTPAALATLLARLYWRLDATPGGCTLPVSLNSGSGVTP